MKVLGGIRARPLVRALISIIVLHLQEWLKVRPFTSYSSQIIKA